VTANPIEAWVAPQARNLLALDERASQFTLLIRDRDAKFTDAFDVVFTCGGIRILRSPVRAPGANAFIERWIGGCRRELLDRILIVNEGHLRQVLAEYETHVSPDRPHRALGHAAPLRSVPDPVDAAIKVIRRDRLGGVIHEYAQVA
jgi:putative transposase